jgi:hypothetical protein
VISCSSARNLRAPAASFIGSLSVAYGVRRQPDRPPTVGR